MPPLRLPALDSQTARQRDIDLQGIIQSGHYVIMPLRILLENAVYGLKEIVYIIFILYILFL